MEMKKFTRDDPEGGVQFELNGVVYEAAASLPAMTMLDLTAVQTEDTAERLRLITGFLDEVLLPESAAAFAASLRDGANPTTVNQLAEVAVWLIQEVYVKERPTQDPSQSPNGSGPTGPSSTDTAPAPGTTPGESQPTGP